MMEISEARIYCNDIETLDKLSDTMTRNGFAVSTLHNEMQEQDRDKVMRDFRTGSTRVLISTDLVSKGKDVVQVNLIINYDLPDKLENYIQRIGRSGIFGRKRASITFVIKEENEKLIQLQKYYKTTLDELPSNLSQI